MNEFQMIWACQGFLFKSLLFPLISQKLIHREKKYENCWWMNLSFNVSCWQLCRYRGAIYVEISSSDVPDVAWKSSRLLPALENCCHSGDLEWSSASGFWWPGNGAVCLSTEKTLCKMTEATARRKRSQITTPSIVYFTVKAAALQRSPAPGGQIDVPKDEIYFSFFTKCCCCFPQPQPLKEVQMFICI